MKTVGIIGGLGPETTSEFYLKIIFQCQKQNTIQRPAVVIASVPLLFEIERDMIAFNKGKERCIPFLVNEAKRLEKSDVDFIVMPCNSLHVFIDEIREAVSIPVLSIVEETINYLKDKNINNVGLISTSATIANNVYEDKLKENNINFTTPDDLQKAQMDKIILRLIEGQHLNTDRDLILKVVEDLAVKGVDAVALACTDLQLLLPSSSKVHIFDTMDVLARSTVKNILD
ncbi:MAG TPA: amino acid racemase [Patescibacteria group bacterium]|jgi:aspartate racemase|nr:amino acid racemase [Patescibacteria group bacterium]